MHRARRALELKFKGNLWDGSKQDRFSHVLEDHKRRKIHQ
jgi:hypothetical protein